ncbi:MAG: polyprenyl synthetase family protein [bacterium]
MESLNSFLKYNKQLVEKWIDKYLPPEKSFPPVIHQAMRYSTLAGGKRLRAILVVEASRIYSGNQQHALAVASAIEMLHAYSLIHDDLPAMDDDDLRRGQLTSHKKFGEDLAILAGDALCTYAWQLISDHLPADKVPLIIKVLGRAVGTDGMIGGQVADMHWHQWSVNEYKILRYIHSRKTAALISASLVSGAIIADAGEKELKKLTQGGIYLGMEFQIVDDLLDELGDENVVGKKLHKDQDENKLTYPGIYGIESAKIMAEKYAQKAITCFSQLSVDSSRIIEIAQYILTRNK